MDSDIGQHRRAAAVAVRFTRDLRAGDAEFGGWRRAGDSGELRQPGASAAMTSSSVSPRPSQRQLSWIGSGGRKTWKNRCARPSLLTRVPSLSANVAGGKHQFGFCGGRGFQMVENDHVLEARQKRVHVRRRGAGDRDRSPE